MRKHLMITLCAMLLMAPVANAQQRSGKDMRPKTEAHGHGSKFNPEEFKRKLEEYIKNDAQLSDTEAAAVFPIFHQLNDKRRALNESLRDTKHSKCENAAEADVVLEAIVHQKEEDAALCRQYYKKMSEAVGACKVVRIVKAEDKFMRNMFRPGGRQGGEHGRRHKQQ